MIWVSIGIKRLFHPAVHFAKVYRTKPGHGNHAYNIV
jgi:hypothetical protein